MSLSKLAATAIGFNEDLMSIIFLHLPVKSVLKCKCVCKYWHSLASNPQFCHQHASLHGLNLTPSALLFQRGFDNSSDFEFCSLTGNSNSTTSISSFDYLNAPANGNLSLLGSSNGLLLFQSFNLPDFFRVFYVCNPSTRKFIRLDLPYKLTRLRYLDATFAFDPCVSPYYKVVFFLNPSNNGHNIAIYSSETKSCSKLMKLGCESSRSLGVLEGSGIFCNGKIYWLVDGRNISLSFDVEQCCFDLFQLPMSANLCPWLRCSGASRGRLYSVWCVSPFHGDNTYVYELKEGSSGWVLKYETGFSIDNLMLSYVSEEQDEGSTLLQLGGPGTIVAYNLKEKTTRKVCDLNPLFNNPNYTRFNQLYDNYRWCGGAYQWIETLSCV